MLTQVSEATNDRKIHLTFISITIFFLVEFMIIYLYSKQHLIKIQLAGSFFHLDWPWHSVIQFSSFHPKANAGNKSIYYFQILISLDKTETKHLVILTTEKEYISENERATFQIQHAHCWMRPNLLSLQWELLQDFWSASSYKLKIKRKKTQRSTTAA